MEQVVIFTVGNQKYGIDIRTVQEIHDAQQTTPLPFSASWHEGVVNIRGVIYTVVNLRKKLNISNQNLQEQDKFIVMHTNRLAFIVDHVEDVANAQESIIHEKPYNQNNDVIDCVFQVNGEMIPILNIQSIIDLEIIPISA